MRFIHFEFLIEDIRLDSDTYGVEKSTTQPETEPVAVTSQMKFNANTHPVQRKEIMIFIFLMCVKSFL